MQNFRGDAYSLKGQKNQNLEKEFPLIDPFEETLENFKGRGRIDQFKSCETPQEPEIDLEEYNIFISYDNTETQNQSTLAGI